MPGGFGCIHFKRPCTVYTPLLEKLKMLAKFKEGLERVFSLCCCGNFTICATIDLLLSLISSVFCDLHTFIHINHGTSKFFEIYIYKMIQAQKTARFGINIYILGIFEATIWSLFWRCPGWKASWKGHSDFQLWRYSSTPNFFTSLFLFEAKRNF